MTNPNIISPNQLPKGFNVNPRIIEPNKLPSGFNVNQTSTPTPTQAPQVSSGFWQKAGNIAGAVGKGLFSGALGVGKTIGEAGIRLAELPTKGMELGTKKLGLTELSKAYGELGTGLEDIRKGVFENPEVTKYTNTIPGKIGEFAGDIGLITSPTKQVATAKGITTAIGKELPTLPTKVGRALTYAARKTLNALPEAAVGFGYGKLKGQTNEEAKKTALLFGALSGAGEIAGDVWKSIKGGIGENVAKAIGFKSIKGISQVPNKVPQATRALALILKNAKDMVVKDINGVEKTFEPAKATYYETLQALKKTKDDVYNAYTELATKAGDKGAVFNTKDFNGIISSLRLAAKDSTTAFKTKTEALIKNLISNFGFYSKGKIAFKDASLSRIQKFLEDINIDVNPLSDRAGAEVSGRLSKKLREILDSKIESSAGKGYQKLRSSYADLKSIEQELLNQFKKASSKGGNWFSSYVEGFGSLESILGIISRNPQEILRGAGVGIFGKIMQTLRDPETYLRRAFQMLESQGKVPSPTSIRAVGGAPAATLPTGVTNYIKNPKIGLGVEDVSKGFKQGAIPPTTKSPIIKTDPILNLKKDVPITDIYGKKAIIPSGEALTPYEVPGNKFILKDGEQYTVSKNQYENIKGNAIKGEAKPFAPELEGLEESVKGNDDLIADLQAKGRTYERGTPEYKKIQEQVSKLQEKGTTKYSQYTLPGGKNYREVLIKVPNKNPIIKHSFEIKPFKNEWAVFEKGDSEPLASGFTKEQAEYAVENQFSKKTQESLFKSSHYTGSGDEVNLGGWLRFTNQKYKGKKVTFMEETQDVMSESSHYDEAKKFIDERFGGRNKFNIARIKRALQEAVNDNSDYFAWTTGEQQSARYNLSVPLKEANWKTTSGQGGKRINLITREKGELSFLLDKDGKVASAGGGIPDKWIGEPLNEVIGKGLADKIMAQESGTLSGEGLKFGGEWANNLYDRQIKNIVEDLTGQKVEMLDMKLPIGTKPDIFRSPRGAILTNNDLKVGSQVNKMVSQGSNTIQDKYIIIDILGDGKFKAVPKDKIYKDKSFLKDYEETFDISQKTTQQMGIKLTPEVKALIKGEAPKLKQPSGVLPNAVSKEKFVKAQGNTSVVRYSGKGFENTDSFRGGTWYSTPESKTYDFEKEYAGQVGGSVKSEANLNIKNPLVIHKASMEDGSGAVIESGYENYLPNFEKTLANKLEEVRWSELSGKKFDNEIKSILKSNKNTEEQISKVLKSTNKLDSAMDLIISKGLKKEGYDSLILENEYKGKVIDKHIFKFADISETKPKSQPTDIRNKANRTKNPPIQQVKIEEIEEEVANHLIGKIEDNYPIRVNEMSANALKYLERYKPKKPIKVYRGISDISDKQGESWTKSRQVAVWYSPEGSKILSRVVTPDEILVDTTMLPKSMYEKLREFGAVPEKYLKEEAEVILKSKEFVKAQGGKNFAKFVFPIGTFKAIDTYKTTSPIQPTPTPKTEKYIGTGKENGVDTAIETEAFNKILPIVKSVSKELNYPADLLMAQLMNESRLIDRVSSSGAKGIAQIMKPTFESYKNTPGQYNSIKKYFDVRKYNYEEVVKDPKLSVMFMAAKVMADSDRNKESLEEGIKRYNPNDEKYLESVLIFLEKYRELVNSSSI